MRQVLARVTVIVACCSTVACDTEGDAPAVEVAAQMSDFLSGAPIVGASVHVTQPNRAAQQRTTDAAGTARFTVAPEGDFTARVTVEGMREHVVYDRARAVNATFSYSFALNSTVAAFEAVLGLSVDDTNAGLFDVLVREKGTHAMIPGMTVTLDVASDIALVLDAESTTGLSVGNVTLAGSESTLVFVNAKAGPITPQFSHPDGYVCDVGPSTVTLEPGTYVFAHYQCARPSAQ